ncbi:stomatin-like isoform X2 [Candoia aspera]|uniref:stomatin-like isoform X2 n=1 Tax=Candoia aspera TaxID=51853 RepID=UPI002FD85E50
MRLGHIRKNVARGPGVYFILPCTDTLIKVDMRTKTFDMPSQEIFTKDPLIIDVDGVVYYRIHDALLAVTKVTNADSATRLLAKAIVKNTLAAQNLCHIISEREKVARDIQVVTPGHAMSPPKPVKEASLFLQESPLSLQLRCLKADSAHPSQQYSTIIFSYP